MPFRPYFRILLILLLSIALNACSGPDPLTTVTAKAIALQVSETQAALRQQLYRKAPEPPAFSISHVRITNQDAVSIEAKKGYHVWGTYDVKFDFGDRQVIQQDNPFDLYLQRDQENQLWSLARPNLEAGRIAGWTLQTLETLNN